MRPFLAGGSSVTGLRGEEVAAFESPNLFSVATNPATAFAAAPAAARKDMGCTTMFVRTRSKGGEEKMLLSSLFSEDNSDVSAGGFVGESSNATNIEGLWSSPFSLVFAAVIVLFVVVVVEEESAVDSPPTFVSFTGGFNANSKQATSPSSNGDEEGRCTTGGDNGTAAALLRVFSIVLDVAFEMHDVEDDPVKASDVPAGCCS